MGRFTVCLTAILVAVFALAGDAGAGWERSDGPVLTQGEGAGASRVRGACVLPDGDIYRMWYEGYWGKEEIIYATSDDGKKWESYSHASPVVPLTRSENMTGSPSVIKDEDGVYHMWYSYCVGGYGDGTWHIGYARSIDGRNWERYEGNPVIANDEINAGLKGVTVVERDGRYHLWASGPGITYASSDNGIEWEMHGGINFEGEDRGWIASPSVTVHNGTFILAYGRNIDDNSYTYFASSEDGKTWKNGFLPRLPNSGGAAAPVKMDDGWTTWCGFSDVDSGKYSLWQAHYTPEE